ncbi:protein translocase subunit secF [Clostridium sp. USBA 49]|jgi:preprotein translocase subunit SecF|uniref:protein translocase subunit SecF n=1 Tax=Clostridium TaxID=1485 RepID=UPI00099A46E4|nr:MULTISPECIES: protein translocase subunit SecF [Clostridium]SKA75789.1 protein translocase subunit secF [Clostridium sp. USBA 49]
MLKIIEKTTLWFTISGIIILLGLVSLAKNGLQFGLDFAGGTIVRIEMPKEENKKEIDDILSKYVSDAQTNFSKVEGKNTVELEVKSKDITDEQVDLVFKELKEKYKLEDKAIISQERIGASVGKELRQKSIIAVSIAIIGMLIYIAIRFEFKFGIAAMLSLVHDVLVVLGFYAMFKLPVNSPFIAAMLTIVGYSINDTIVVFDRIRENQKYIKKSDPVALANASMTQTMARSINTGLAVIIALIVLYFYVPSVREFTVPLLVGVISGTYSSIFIATPFWVILKKRSKKSKTVKVA